MHGKERRKTAVDIGFLDVFARMQCLEVFSLLKLPQLLNFGKNSTPPPTFRTPLVLSTLTYIFLCEDRVRIEYYKVICKKRKSCQGAPTMVGCDPKILKRSLLYIP